VSAPGPTGHVPSADLKRSEALLREARAALRRLDTLMSDAQDAQDPVTPLVAECAATSSGWSGSSLADARPMSGDSALPAIRRHANASYLTR
jgi:hypothetical protein